MTKTKFIHWNTRVVKKTEQEDLTDYVTLGIYEVYYDAERNPAAVIEEPCTVIGWGTGEDVDEARLDLDIRLAQIQEALKFPVLEWDDIPLKLNQAYFDEVDAWSEDE